MIFTDFFFIYWSTEIYQLVVILFQFVFGVKHITKKNWKGKCKKTSLESLHLGSHLRGDLSVI